MFPPGHSSWLKIIGQFSIATFTPSDSASSTIAGQTLRNSSRFSGTGRDLSLPTNVVTVETPSRAAARITLRVWSLTAARCSGSGWRLFG